MCRPLLHLIIQGKLAIVHNHWSSAWYMYDAQEHISLSGHLLTNGHVVSSPTLNTIKACLDRFWENQDVHYNWKDDILYTGSRSNVELMFWLLYSDCTIFGVIYNGLDIEVHNLRPAIYTTTTTTTTTVYGHFWPKTLRTRDTLALVPKCLGHFDTTYTSYTEVSH